MENQVRKPTRPWHPPESENGSIDQVYESGLKTRFMNQVDKPDQSIISINQIRNQVDKPKTANQVYKPSSITLGNLRGNPLRVIRFLFGAIDNFQEKITRKIQLVEIMQALEITRDSARTGLKFLNKSNLISTVDYFAGLYGWTRYKMQDEIFNEIWSINQVHKSDSKPGLISSNSSNLNTTTKIDQVELDINPLTGHEKFKFTHSHVTQLLVKNTPEQVQESIYQFAFDLENNKKWRDHENPLNVFMGRVGKGIPWTAENYESPEEIALRESLAAKKRKLEKIEQMNRDLAETEFKLWESSLTAEERKIIAPDRQESFANAKLRAYFNEHVLPSIKSSST